MPLSRRQFVRTVPALGAFTVSAESAHAQQASAAAVWPLPPSTPAWRDESFPTQHPRSALDGRYVFGAGPRDAFTVKAQGAMWGIQREGGEMRGLTHIGDLQFHPVGTPAVRVRFDRAQSTLTILDPDVVVVAKKS